MEEKKPVDNSKVESPQRLTLEEAAAKMTEAIQSSVKAYRDAETAFQKRTLEANDSYAYAVRNLYQEIRKRHEQVFKDLFAAAFEGASAEDRSKQQTAMGTRYSEMLVDLEAEFKLGYEQAHRDYTNKLASAWTNASKAYTDAYRSYLQSQQRVWTDLNVDALVSNYARTLGANR